LCPHDLGREGGDFTPKGEAWLYSAEDGGATKKKKEALFATILGGGKIHYYFISNERGSFT